MRVAMLGRYPLDASRIVGGPEAVVSRLLEGLGRLDDLDLHVVTCQVGVSEPRIERKGGATIHYLPRKRAGHVTWYVRDRRRVAPVLREIHPDVVHAQGSGMYAGMALDSGLPAVITVHGIRFREAAISRGGWHRFQRHMAAVYERRNISRAREIIAITPYVLSEFERWTKARVHNVENPVDDRLFSLPDRSEPGRVLYAGLVIPRKSALDLVKAWPGVLEMIPGARLQIAGETGADPDYAEAVMRYVREHSWAASVNFLGSLRQEELLEQYARCAVLVLPSLQETAPVVVSEAMAAGRPVVATRVCGLPHMVVEGATGHLVEYGDTDALTRAIVGVLADDSRRVQMGRRARELAEERFRTDAVARKTYEVYRLASEGKTGRG